MPHYIVYVRRSYKRDKDGEYQGRSADVSDETQEQVARSLIPAGAAVEVIRDTGGHQSGATDDRDGYQAMIRRVRDGGVAGIAVYDLSRLARDVRLMANLRDELDRRQVALLAGNLPNSRFDSAVGRFMFNMIVSAAQFQRDLDSERMTSMARRTFEDGGHRGNDPFGYRTLRDDKDRIVQPRQLVIVADEATVVRRIWSEIAHRSYTEVAAILNAESVPHRSTRPWGQSAVKDITRRGRFYLGYVVEKRGRDERPGRHEPILDEQTYQAGMAGILERSRGRIRRPPKHRTYVLSGVLFCAACSKRMVGQTQTSRGQEWRYYVCKHCPAPSVFGNDAEQDVLDMIATMHLPESVIDNARAELRRRLEVPTDGLIDRKRARFDNRLAQLRKQHEWGDIDDAEYRRKATETRAELAALPAGDKVVAFDRFRMTVESMAASIDRATPEQRAELVRMLVERVTARDRRVEDVAWTPAARPFFSISLAPPDGTRRRITIPRPVSRLRLVRGQSGAAFTGWPMGVCRHSRRRDQGMPSAAM